MRTIPLTQKQLRVLADENAELRTEIDADGVWIDKAIDQKLKCEQLQADLAASDQYVEQYKQQLIAAEGEIAAKDAEIESSMSLNEAYLKTLRRRDTQITTLTDQLSAAEAREGKLRKVLADRDKQIQKLADDNDLLRHNLAAVKKLKEA